MSTTETLDEDFGLITDLVRETARVAPDRLAFIQDQRELTYGALEAMIDRVATALQRDSIPQRSAIAICAGTSIEYACVFFGGLRAGIAVSPLAPSSTAEQLAGMVADCGASLLFLDKTTADSLSGAGDASLRRIALDDSAAGEPLSAWLAPPGSKPRAVEIAPADPFNIIYSSGTTGAPKGIVQSHRMRWAHVRRAGFSGFDETARTMLSTPLYSNTTLVAFFPTIAGGGCAILMGKFDALRFLELAEKHRATHAMLVPVQYSRIMARPEFDSFDLTSFRVKNCTSAPFSAALKADIVKRWPGGLAEYYGMTEGGGTCILLAHEFPDKLDTVGQPAEGHDVRLIDEDGNEVAPGGVGEIVGYSTATMNGYHNQPGKTADAQWVAPDGRVFMRTGDVGRFDSDGFLHLMDRKKDMIISGGFNVYPSDLETILLSHPAVQEAAVVGVASEQWGETPVAFVVRRAGTQADAEEIRSFANDKLGKTQRLADVRLMESLPRSAIGKILKRDLRDDYAAQAWGR
jgi:long-chain acyl-CoA synthetase